jgi:CDP-diacylglycerol--glycerol-3-phosphate 3-phosphatidyltransferase
MKKEEIFTVSNLLSFLRIFLVFPIFYHLANNERIGALIYIVIAVITDILDGYIARKFGQITDLGKLLDPLADKVCTVGGLIALSLYQGFPWWLTIVIIIRDIFIILGSLFLMGKRSIIVASNVPGKITVMLISLAAIVYVLRIEILFSPLNLLVTIMIIYSGINYLALFYNKYRQ